MGVDERHYDFIYFDEQELKVLLSPFCPESEVRDLQPLLDGAGNTNYRFKAREESYVVRFFSRDLGQLGRDEKLYHLLSRSVSIPEPVYSDLTSFRLPFTIYRFLPGRPVAELKDRALLARKLGRTLASIHQFTFPTAGIFNEGFTTTHPFPRDFYFTYPYDTFSGNALVRERLGESLSDDLVTFIETHKHCFPKISKTAASLVHSDFKPSNLIWGEDGTVHVLDWEYVHAGNGLYDLSIFLREGAEIALDHASFKSGYEEIGEKLPVEWIFNAAVTDTCNIAYFLSDSSERPELFRCFKERIRQLILTSE